MGMPRLKTAFCGRPVEKGALIIGWFCTISSGLVWSMYLSLIPGFFAVFDHEPAMKVFISIFGTLLTYLFVIESLLLYGLLKKNHYFMLPKIVVNALFLIICFLITAGLFFASFIIPPLLIIFVLNNVVTGISVYFFLVIYSRYQDIKCEQKHNANIIREQQHTQELV